MCAGFSKGGARKFRKFENNEDQNQNFAAQKPSPFSCPKLGEDQKKVFAHRFCAQTLCPSYKGVGHAAILHTILCYLYYPGDPKTGAWPNDPPKYAPGAKQSTRCGSPTKDLQTES